ncbi:hypothetical protein GCM10009122_23780 [Fulvivirga kasyanovii]|uniref:Tetratricopeptide repeat protein n=1 Tax=Fulvivirga kasyanovii TaxID=396812 RepID=A0ABW9RHV6_9BACT|nr:hypothetical protein [Fulvivirga kasyanovii]MTI23500.1 hypothetical protein [Fulvivirga kasyanovii]
MNQQELTEKYFSSRLTSDEFKQLEQVLKNDSQLRAEFFNELEIKQTIAQEKHSTLKSRFQELDNKTKKKISWFRYAAAVAFLTAVGSIIYSLQPNYQNLYTENFEVYPNVINLTTRSETEQETNEMAAFDLYEDGNYSEAAKNFNKAYEKEPKDYLIFYKGMSLLAQSETEEGIRVLQSYEWEKNKSDFTAVANWYLGLAFLKQKQSTKAQFYLEKVARSDSNLSKQAQKLLIELD